MEDRKPPKGSSSSSTLTSQLFGSRDSMSSSVGIFGSMFAPSTKVLGRESLRSEPSKKRQDSSLSETLYAKSGAQVSFTDDAFKGIEGESQGIPNGDMSSIYQEQRVLPCHLCSSIYYGGQDIYNHPQNNQSSKYNSTFKKDSSEDDSGSASRGNWWQGSLYY